MPSKEQMEQYEAAKAEQKAKYGKKKKKKKFDRGLMESIRKGGGGDSDEERYIDHLEDSTKKSFFSYENGGNVLKESRKKALKRLCK